jgi:hypothetical protein
VIVVAEIEKVLGELNFVTRDCGNAGLLLAGSGSLNGEFAAADADFSMSDCHFASFQISRKSIFPFVYLKLTHSH